MSLANTAKRDRFELIHPLGEGSFGAVYEALDRVTNERVAVKELTRANASSLARFKQEFRAISSLHHPNLVELRELFEHEGRWFIAMELIDGEELLSFVRGRAANDQHSLVGFDEARLRGALVGIARGLSALHQHGFLHRDLKPSNILVTKEGRAILLDFGLVTASDPHAQSSAGQVGTAAYMAPEQAASKKVGPAADFYALGVCLYEALTGRLPFDGDNSFQILFAKQGKGPVKPSTHVPHLPIDLEQWCLALLESDPERRIEAASKLLADGVTAIPLELSSASQTGMPAPFFRGRDDQLLLLDQAFSRSQQGELTIVLVEGESGVGKSALVQEFIGRCLDHDPDAFVLRGRCYENERVPFKAFDGCMDELGKVLKRMPRPQCAELLPKRATLLTQLFPVLREVDALRRATLGDTSADPTARRLEAFAAMAALFRNLTKQHPLIVVIDDIQWADGESFRMLRALVEDPERPPLLLLCTVRPREELDSEVSEPLELVRRWLRTTVITLQGLTPRNACALAAQLLPKNTPVEWCEHIAAESKGHPLFIAELVKYAASHALSAPGSLTIEAALMARIDRLDPNARQLLDLVALAGRPYGSHVFARALGFTNGLGDVSKHLLMEKLLLVRKDQGLVCFHDRIRHTVVAQLTPSRQRVLHAQLANVLEGLDGIDPSERAHHWDRALEPERAVAAYEVAAERAFENLAFARTEQLCRRALELVGDERGARVRTLSVLRARALASGGRSAEAAQAYEDAAKVAEGEEQVRLRVLVAQQLLRSLQADVGLHAARSVLSDLGVPLPEGARQAVSRLAWDRACLSVRGLSVTTRPSEEVPQQERLVLDALSDLSFPISWLELLPGASLNARHLRRALSAGETAHVVRALCREAMLRVMQNPAHSRGYEPLIAQCRALLKEHPAPDLEGELLLVEGSAASLRLELDKACEDLVRAQEIFQTKCPGEPWFLTNVRMSLGSARFSRGDHTLLAQESEAWIKEASERQDRFAIAALFGLGFGGLRFMMRDTPEVGLEQIRAAMAPWPTQFSLAHLGELMAVSWTGLYAGGDYTAKWLEQHRARLDRAFLLKRGTPRGWLLTFRVLGRIASLSESSSDKYKEALTHVRGDIDRLDALNASIAPPLAPFLRAQVDVLEGNAQRALEHVRIARERLHGLGHFLVHSAVYLEGTLEGGASGQNKCEKALSFFRDQGWQNPLRAVRMSVPSLFALEEKRREGTQRGRELIQNRYEILRPLGGKTSGYVAEARDTSTGRKCLLKELIRPSSATLARFKREFRALQDLHHPNLVRLDALFEESGRWFMVMEWVDGTDFLSWVRPAGALDQARLCAALVGLVRGLLALHDAGLVHGGLRPLDIRVSPEGRVVILDLGLVASNADGTRECPVPELSLGAPLTGASDAHALGVCLYEALTGSAWEDGVRVIAFSNEVSHELASFCKGLLEPDPERRWSLTTLLEQLVPNLERVSAYVGSPFVQGARVPFAGRQRELATLEEAFRQARAGELSVVLVEGESGLGKSALVAEFVRRRHDIAPDMLVLESRCYENELVAFKAFDGAMDELARFLRSLEPAACRALLPPEMAALGQLFPALCGVPAIATAPTRMLSADPTARRMEGFSALRELLRRIARTRPLVLVIDDLQWADTESVRLLMGLLGGSAPLPMLMLCTLRPSAELPNELSAPIAAIAGSPRVRVLALSGLSEQDARALANQLLGSQVNDAQAEALARECKGHPLFLAELLFHTQEYRTSSNGINLDQSLRARVTRLPLHSRVLLQQISLLGRPCSAHVFARALGHCEGLSASVNEAVATLLAQKLVRIGRDQSLLFRHDRIRHVVVQAMTSTEARLRSYELAQALEREPSVDHAELARLWDAAGEVERALSAYEVAADRALDALAFAWAEERYARALQLAEKTRDARFRRLVVARGHALARSGRSAEAAEAYQQAAEAAEGEERIRLRIRAAQQLLFSAQLEPGMRAVRATLAEVGMSLPESDGASLRRVAWDRACLALRRLDIKESAPREPSAEEKLKLEVLAEIAFPVAWVELLPGATLNGRHLRLALSTNDPSHVVRALCDEAAFRAINNPGDTKSYLPLFARSRAILPRVSTPELEAFQTLTEAVSAMFRSDLRVALHGLSAAHDELKTRCPGEPWLLTNARLSLGEVYVATGEHARLARETQAWLAEARERRDRFALAALSGLGFGCLRFLLEDRPEEADAELREVMEPWQGNSFTLAHWGEFRALSWVKLYSGGSEPFRWLSHEEERLDRAFLTRTAFAKEWRYATHALMALCALRESAPTSHPEILRSVERHTKKLKRLGSPFSTPMAALVSAQRSAIAGDLDFALSAARSAREGYERAGLGFAHHARYLEGVLEGGDLGRQRREESLSFFRGQGFVNEQRALKMFLPALDLIRAP